MRLDIRKVTINRFLSLLLGTSSSGSTGAFLAVVDFGFSSPRFSARSSLSLSSRVFASDALAEAFLRESSASRALGRVGDSSAGSRRGDLSLLASFFAFRGGGGSGFLGFVGRVPSTASSRALFFSPFSAAFWLSQLKCNGDRRGGTDDREDWSILVGVFFVLPEMFGRTPLTESPRARPAGEGLRAVAEVLELLRRLRPLVSDEELVGLRSREE